MANAALRALPPPLPSLMSPKKGSDLRVRIVQDSGPRNRHFTDPVGTLNLVRHAAVYGPLVEALCSGSLAPSLFLQRQIPDPRLVRARLDHPLVVK